MNLAKALRNQLDRNLANSPHHTWLWLNPDAGEAAQHLIRLTPFLSEVIDADGVIACSVVRFHATQESHTTEGHLTTTHKTLSCVVNSLGRNRFQCQVKPIVANLPVEKQLIGIPGIGLINLTKVFAGNFYLIANARELGINLENFAATRRKAEDFGQWILQAAPLSFSFIHPQTLKETQPVAVIFSGEAEEGLRQVVVYAGCQPDRSPGLVASVASSIALNQQAEPMVVTGIAGDRIILRKAAGTDPEIENRVSFEITAEAELLEEGLYYLNDL